MMIFKIYLLLLVSLFIWKCSTAQKSTMTVEELCGTSDATCSECFNLLAYKATETSEHQYNLTRAFYPPTTSTPVYVMVKYLYINSGGTMVEANHTWFWSTSTYYLYQPPEVLQYISLFFADLEFRKSILYLTLPIDCMSSKSDFMQLLTQREGLDMARVGSQPISRLAHTLRPRYHFAGLHNKFYERTPYRNHRVLKDAQRHVTRFISLGNVGNPDKKNRYIYAFSVAPLTSLDHSELVKQPPATTDNPFTDIVRSQPASQAGALPEQNFFFDPKALATGRKRHEREEGKGKRGPPFKKKPHHQPVARGPCWFCLGGEQVEKHLVVSVGDQSYMALPKGGLVPDHVLILPIGHFAATTDLTEDIAEEMVKYKSALRQYCQSKGKSCVIFERNYKSQHLQLQVIPVPETPSDALRQAFIDHGKAFQLQMTEVPREASISKLAQVGEPYFMVEFDDGGHLFTKIKGRFPLQFGREVLASSLILNVPHKVDWKNCSATRQEEELAAQNMRKQFEPFDFTNEDDD